MQKELLQKIYNLRKIKPDTGFVSDTKRIITESNSHNEAKTNSILKNPLFSANALSEVVGFLKTPVNYNSKVALSSAFIFLLAFTFFISSSFPLTSDYNNDFLENEFQRIAVTTEDEDEVRVVAEDEENNKEVARTEKPVEQQFIALESNLRRVQKEVLGMIIKEEEDQELTDREIADYIAASIEKQRAGEDTVSIMQIEPKEVKDNPELDQAMEIYKAERYEEFIHAVLDTLNTKELLDILSE